MEPINRFEDNKSLILFVYRRGFTKYITFKDDLLQEGAGALWKCCLNFDENRNVQFSTYACVSIQRAMQRFVNTQILKHINDISVETIIFDNCDSNIRLEECLSNLENNTTKDMLDECLKKLPVVERKVIERIFKGYKQREIANIYNITQQSVSKILIKFKHLILIENLKNKEVIEIMRYAKKQAEDILTLAYHYAIKNSKEEEKVGCYIVSENGWRTVLAKGCKTEHESALKNATQKIRPESCYKANNHTLFITRADIDVKLIFRYGIKTIIHGGDSIDDKIKEILENRNIDIIHITDWKPNESN